MNIPSNIVLYIYVITHLPQTQPFATPLKFKLNSIASRSDYLRGTRARNERVGKIKDANTKTMVSWTNMFVVIVGFVGLSGELEMRRIFRQMKY